MQMISSLFFKCALSDQIDSCSKIILVEADKIIDKYERNVKLFHNFFSNVIKNN